MKKMFENWNEKFKERDEVKKKDGRLILLVVLAIILIVLIGLVINRISIEKANSISLNNLDKVLALDDDGNGGKFIGDENAVGARFDANTGVVTIYSIGTSGTINRDNLLAFWDICGKSNITEIVFEGEVYAPWNSISLFSELSSLITIRNANNFKTNTATDMSRMFEGCISLESLDASSWDISNVVFTTSMFKDCENLAELNVTGWNTSNVKGMNLMFEWCFSLDRKSVV